MTVTNSGRDTSAQDKTGALEKSDLIHLTIDDIEVAVPKGTLLIRAAEVVGIEIPRFCDHPLLDPVGACRQCLVEITDAGNGRAMPKPQASCTIEVADGMKVKTQVTSPVAKKAQEGNMEFLLINHPLDCPICDKGGECPLQNQSLSHGTAESRYEGVKRTFPKPIPISAEVLLDRERCILCARCTRFSDQIAGDQLISMAERGAEQQVGIYAPEPFDSYFSGNTIQICPVGALTSAAYRFRSRPFDLVSTPSIAEHDAAGAAIRVDHRRGVVMRRQSGDDPHVNEEWISDKDRFAFRSGRGDDRVTRPLVRDADGSFRVASWPEALDVAARGLAAASGRAGVLPGGRLTMEESYAYGKFARVVLGTNSVDFRSRPQSPEEQDFLAHAVAGTGLTYGTGTSIVDIERAATVLCVAFEPEEECPTLFLRLRKAHRKHGQVSWTLAPYLSRGADKMGAGLVPTAPGAEAEVLASLPAEISLGADAVILVGERAALSPGALSAVVTLARTTGTRLVWVPRRAGDRGAVEAGCLPNLLPGGRPIADAEARVDTQSLWGVDALPAEQGLPADDLLAGVTGALVVGGVEMADFADPEAALAGVEDAGFVVSLEQRMSEVAQRADVVLPVCLTEEKAGSYLNLEGRRREFGVVIGQDDAAPTVMSDLRVLAALAEAMGRPLGFRTPADAAAELGEFGPWDGTRAPAPAAKPRVRDASQPVLATWRLLLDDSRSVDYEAELQQTAHDAVIRLHPRTAAAAGIAVPADGQVDGLQLTLTVTGRGGEDIAVTAPAELVPDMVAGVVWAPARTRGMASLAGRAGQAVRIAEAGRAGTDHEGGTR